MIHLFSAYSLKDKQIKNRLVFPPVVCFNYAGDDGIPSDRNIAHYLDYSKADIGLVIVEATCISPHGKLHTTQLGIWDDKMIPAFKKIADNAKAYGSTAIVQIQHSGLKTDRNSTDAANIFAPSPYKLEDGTMIREILEEEIETTIKEFADGAVRCYEAGFDGVEIHGAHGYLLSQFMSPAVNKRADQYGKDKALLGVKIIKAIQERVPESFIIAMRMGGNDPDIKTSIEYAKAFVNAGVDLLHISTGFVSDRPADYAEADEDYNWVANLGILVKRQFPHVPVIAVNGIDNPALADAMIQRGHVDFAASARGLLSDYNWLEKYANNEAPVKCFQCKACKWREDGAKCPARIIQNK